MVELHEAAIHIAIMPNVKAAFEAIIGQQTTEWATLLLTI